jgi:hypothetical protein
MEYFNPSNAFDAEGLARLTEQIERRKKIRNDIEQDTMIQVRNKNLETERQALEIDRELEYARLAQEREFEMQRATQRADVARQRAEKEQEAERAQIGAREAVDRARRASERAVEEERIVEDVRRVVGRARRRAGARGGAGPGHRAGGLPGGVRRPEGELPPVGRGRVLRVARSAVLAAIPEFVDRRGERRGDDPAAVRRTLAAGSAPRSRP